MSTELWTQEQEEYLRYLYSDDCMIMDIVSDFNQKFGTNRSKQSLIHKAGRLNISSNLNGKNRYNQIKMKKDKQERLYQTNMSNDGTLMKIIEYKGSDNVLVEFQDDFHYQVWVAYNDFKKGVVKNPYWRQLYGRGYLGVGQYAPYIKKGVKTKAHDAWIRMFDRCYSEKYQRKYPTYIGCEVCEEWWNFQNFAKWFYDNYYEIEGQNLEVDKDWYVIGNKLYSPDNCCLVPTLINTCTLTHAKVKNYDIPIGVSWHKNGSYVARCSNRGRRITIGYYNNVKDAEKAYWKYKINYISELAEEYKQYIPSRLYNAMKDFKDTYKLRYNLTEQCEVI